jgi:hypothetical protein
LSTEVFEIQQKIENVVTPKNKRTAISSASEICLNASYTKCAKNESVLFKDAKIDPIAKNSINESILDPIAKNSRNESILAKDVNIDSIAKSAKSNYMAKSAKNEAFLAQDANTDFTSISAKKDYIAKSAKNDSILAQRAKIEYIAGDAKIDSIAKIAKNDSIAKSAKIKYIAKEAKIDSMKSVHTNSQVPCAECGKVFRNIMLLKGHVNNVHIKVPCSICQDMIGKGRLSFHMHQKHTPASERKYKCEICGKGFCDKSRLKDHINVHTGEKPHKCKFCDKGFASFGTKAGHERSHMGLKRNK